MNLVIGGRIVIRGIKEVFNSKKVVLSTKIFYLTLILLLFPKIFLYKITGRLVSPHFRKNETV